MRHILTGINFHFYTNDKQKISFPPNSYIGGKVSNCFILFYFIFATVLSKDWNPQFPVKIQQRVKLFYSHTNFFIMYPK